MAQGNPELLKSLGEIDPKQPYGIELFDALARLTVSVAVEAVCLRLREGIVEVYLVQRSMTDTAYPGEWHCPGSVFRPGESIDNVMCRLGRKEFGMDIYETKFVANVNHPTEARGHFFSLVYLCELFGDSELKGKWFPVDQLPEKTVEIHRVRIIPAAVGAFVVENPKTQKFVSKPIQL